MMHIGRLRGHWRRSLIAWPDGRCDTTSEVDWLQGPSLYVDLRQPDGQPQLEGVRCLRDLAPSQAVALARQEGFAGTLVRHADHFEWTRLIDFQPTAAHDDRGTLAERHGMLVEKGYGVSYREHWHAQAAPTTCAALSLRDLETGCVAILVRGGDCFMYARSRPRPVRPGVCLRDGVRDAPTRDAAQTLVDCEISIGSIPNAWTIVRSTLPWRVGASIAPCRAGARFATADAAYDGRRFRRAWSICVEQGVFCDETQAMQARAVEA